jgi:hypothetical protein
MGDSRVMQLALQVWEVHLYVNVIVNIKMVVEDKGCAVTDWIIWLSPVSYLRPIRFVCPTLGRAISRSAR